MISIRNLTRRYGDAVAVDNVSLEIRKGEIVGLLGQNGAGKTTMMKVLTGYLEPTSGTASIGGFDVTENRIEVQRLVGYLPENAPLYREMLVQEYLLLMARLRRIPAGERERAVARAALATGLEKHLVVPIAHLSKGYRQRVGLAQAILHEPAVLILDEPTNGLDPTQIQTIRTLIKELGKKSTIILSTHILQEIEAVCDRVLVLIQGKLAADAPLGELLHSKNVRLSMKAGGGVAPALKALDGVTGVTELGTDPADGGFALWRVHVAGDKNPIPAIVELAGKQGWSIGSVAREDVALQQVFHELQERAAREARS